MPPPPQVEALVLRVVLPAMSLNPSNPALVTEVWRLLQLFPYTKRFEMYVDFKVRFEMCVGFKVRTSSGRLAG